MATRPDITPVPVMQPGFRPFIVYDHLPEGMVSQIVPDGRNEPHLRLGEVLVIDPGDREPMHGELFAIQWKSGPENRASILVTNWMHQLSCWAVGGFKPAFIAERAGAGQIATCYAGDFGYRSDYMRVVIIGRAIGILEPSFAEPLR